jgi:ATP phosphoribosyltransferase
MTVPLRRETADRTDPIILALPKGRILPEVMPLLTRAGIRIEPEFESERSRKLRFHTNIAGLTVVRVRSFDVATFVAFGAAHLGIAGSDVLMEFDYPELYAPIDLGVGRCRIAVAEPRELVANDDPSRWSHVRVATKYPETARRYFAARGVQAECIALSGAMELAPQLGLCNRIVDLVQTGATLKANGLAEIETIAEVSARLVVNRTALKLHPEAIGDLVTRMQEAVNAA